MCGRYHLSRPDMLVAIREALPTFEGFGDLRLVPRYNVAPGQDVPVVRTSGVGRPALDLVRWGLIPSWTKGKPKARPINARGETVATSGMFRQAFERPEPEAEPVDTFTIVTTSPNPLMRAIHDRMPVILAEMDYARWLDRETPGKAVADLIQPYDWQDFETTPVSTLVNSPKNDVCDCIAPLADS